MLGRVQRRLAELYDVELPHDVADFLCDEEEARQLGGDDAARRGEVLFVVEEPDGARVALFLAPQARAPMAGEAWLRGPERLAATALAVEGVSHFAYLAFRAGHALGVSELELELQAEVDKWALGLLAPWRDLGRARLLAGRGVGLVRLRERSRRLRELLFVRPGFLDAAGSERGDRYRAAHRFAARYARALEDGFVLRGDVDGLTRELRRFYRLGLREKMERIAG